MVDTQTLQEIITPPHFKLDPSFFRPSSDDWEFMRKTITIAKDDEEIKRRVFEVQAEAFAATPYPCIQLFQFIRPSTNLQPIYPTVIEEAKKNPDGLYLDLACCMGTDTRKAVLDGIPGNRVIGCDIKPEFLDAGYKLFADRDTTEISFFADDIFTINPSIGLGELPSSIPLREAKELNTLRGRITYICVTALFHLFNEKQQREIAQRLANLLCVPKGGKISDAPVAGCILFGRHQTLENPGVIDKVWGSERFAHTPNSWASMWQSVFEERNGHAFASEHVQTSSEVKMVKAYNDREIRLMYWHVRII